MAEVTKEAPIGVVGSGTMGADLSAYLLAHGHKVKVWSRQPEPVARGRIARVLDRYAAPEKEGGLGRLSVVRAAHLLDGCPLVIESVIEDLSTKREVMADLSQALSPSALLTSNTSVLGEAVFAELPEARLPYVAGLHFFNPVFRMELVEVNVHRRTSDQTRDKLLALLEALGKHPVVVPNVYGGVVSRMVLLLINEGARLVDAGLTPKQVDESVRFGAHHPMGPLALADVVGLDVVLANLEALFELQGDERFRAQGNLARLVEAGHLGRKTGRGFYVYDRELEA